MTMRLTRRARADLDSIRDYTQDTWGDAQWETYFAGLVAAFEKIAADPSVGRDRSLLGEGMRSLLYEQHIIFFAPVAVVDGAPVILRILHQRRYLPALIYYEDIDV